MKRCPSCKININTDRKTCPLCYDILEDVDDKQLEKHERLTDVILLAIDQMYLMLEPIIWNEVSVDSLSELPIFHNVNKEFWEGTVMVELYAVMVQRGLKTIDQVPARYRARVEELLANVE